MKLNRKKIVKWFIIFLVVYVSVILGLIINHIFLDDVLFTLKGDSEVTIKLDEVFDDPLYNIYIKDKDNNDFNVVIDNPINNKKIGTYLVKYKLIGKNTTKTLIRKVHVIDDIAPSITLKGNKTVYVCPSKKYVEEGYTAFDNYDLDITDKVKVLVNTDSILYKVSDSSSNTKEEIRKIIYKDNIAPSIDFDLDNSVYLGNTFKDSYSAIDNCDGDITSMVKVSGNIDTNKVGKYTLVYTVTDKSGNETSVKRDIYVKEKPKNRSIYLTFDDGPSSDITPKILDLLKKYNIKATFFVINHDDSTNYIIKHAYDEGHTIGMHSYTHKYSSIYKSDEDYFNDLEKIENKVISITGTSSKIIRFPGGSSNTVSKNYNNGIMSRLAHKVMENGYIYQDWNVGSQDTETQNPDKICHNVTSTLGNGANIVLMHDASGHNGTYNALECIIEYANNNGYTFYKLDSNSPVSHHRIAN